MRMVLLAMCAVALTGCVAAPRYTFCLTDNAPPECTPALKAAQQAQADQGVYRTQAGMY